MLPAWHMMNGSKVLSEYKSKPGFVNFSTGWENQFTPDEMFCIFWYEKEKNKAESKRKSVE